MKTITKTIVKEINLLDIVDIEQAVSKHLKREVSISEIDCALVYCIPLDTGKPSGMYLELTIGEDFCDSWELFYDDELEGFYLDGEQIKFFCLDESWLPVNEIFNFDISAFKSYDCKTDMSD